MGSPTVTVFSYASFVRSISPHCDPTLAIRLSLVRTSTRARRSNSNSLGRFVSLPTRFFLRLHRAPSLRVYLNSRHPRHPSSSSSPLFASALVPITPSLNTYHIVIVITIVIIIIHPTVSCIDALRFIRAYALNAFIHPLLFGCLSRHQPHRPQSLPPLNLVPTILPLSALRGLVIRATKGSKTAVSPGWHYIRVLRKATWRRLDQARTFLALIEDRTCRRGRRGIGYFCVDIIFRRQMFFFQSKSSKSLLLIYPLLYMSSFVLL